MSPRAPSAPRCLAGSPSAIRPPVKRTSPRRSSGGRKRPRQSNYGSWPPGPRRRSSVLRSEEHTSELQSHSDLVCRLLLEKKKDKETQKLPTQSDIMQKL